MVLIKSESLKKTEFEEILQFEQSVTRFGPYILKTVQHGAAGRGQVVTLEGFYPPTEYDGSFRRTETTESKFCASARYR